MKLEQLPIWPRILAAKPRDCKTGKPLNILRAVRRAGGLKQWGPVEKYSYSAKRLYTGLELTDLYSTGIPGLPPRQSISGWPGRALKLREFSDEVRAVRRAKADPKFLKRETKRIITEICSNLNFDRNITRRDYIIAPLAKKLPTIPVQATTVEEHGGCIRRIGKDWAVVADYQTWLHRSEGSTTWKNGRPVDYTRAICINHIRSFADARNCRRITFYFLEAKLVRVAPDGFRWNVDANGLRLIRPDGADYHPDASELLRADWATHCCGQLAANAARRLEELKNERAIATASARGVRVGMQDSIAAGNCRAGTLAFCQRNQLDPQRWYSPDVLFRIANGDAQRVRLAVTAAVRRHDAIASCGADVFYPTK